MSVWDAFQDLCDRRAVGFDDCREQLLGMRAEAKDLNVRRKI